MLTSTSSQTTQTQLRGALSNAYSTEWRTSAPMSERRTVSSQNWPRPCKGTDTPRASWPARKRQSHQKVTATVNKLKHQWRSWACHTPKAYLRRFKESAKNTKSEPSSRATTPFVDSCVEWSRQTPQGTPRTASTTSHAAVENPTPEKRAGLYQSDWKSIERLPSEEKWRNLEWQNMPFRSGFESSQCHKATCQWDDTYIRGYDAHSIISSLSAKT